MASSRLLGRSPPMLRVYEEIGRAAGSDGPVLITGEPGTGKRLVAEILHASSPRRQGRLVEVACAALPETLLESELFGHEKGSFTSAYQQRKGRFELADKGTIFLDEMGEMGLSIQTKLLRALREKAFERVGGAQTIHIDSRVIAATTTNLAEAVRRGRFREDLHDRLGATTIPLPPLRERGGDLLLLIGHFLDRYRFVAGHPPAAIAPAAVAVMERYSWPGNVRELETTIERAVTLARGGLITPAHLGTLGDQPGRPGP